MSAHAGDDARGDFAGCGVEGGGVGRARAGGLGGLGVVEEGLRVLVLVLVLVWVGEVGGGWAVRVRVGGGDGWVELEGELV